MGVRDDTVRLVRAGESPGKIAEIMQVNPKTTLGYLDEMVGRGWIRRFDIFFTIPKTVRKAVIRVLEKAPTSHPEYIADRLKSDGLAVKLGDVYAVVKYRDTQNALGDMYEDIRDIETNLHLQIREVLEKELGKGEYGLWRKGIPEAIRTDCHSKREKDEEPVSDPYCYTDLIDLWKIIDKNWKSISENLPKDVKSNKKKLEEDFTRLNRIRNMVMHPVRGLIPTEDDFDFIRDFKSRLFN